MSTQSESERTAACHLKARVWLRFTECKATVTAPVLHMSKEAFKDWLANTAINKIVPHLTPPDDPEIEEIDFAEWC